MKRRSARGAIIAVFLLGIVIFSAVYFAWSTVTDVFQPVSPPGSGRVIPLEIKKGETTAQIADDLQAKGLIHNAIAFRLWARIKGLDKQLQAGGYDHLNTSMSISDIIDQLLTGSPDVFYVTIPEGYRIEQIAQAFVGAGLVKFNEQDFLKYTKHPDQFPDAAKYPILQLLPRGNSMEGLLFPATYTMQVDANARDAVNSMLTAFDNYVQKTNIVARARANKLNEYQMIILASIVQREVANIKDAPGIAGVYWNRFKNDVPNDTAGYLDADPTVQYARDSQTTPQRYWLPLQNSGKNIASNSPWNTYVNRGLPPTPICSPGLVALQSAASPAMSNYFYFLNTKTGATVYARTYQEFQQDQQKYLH